MNRLKNENSKYFRLCFDFKTLEQLSLVTKKLKEVYGEHSTILSISNIRSYSGGNPVTQITFIPEYLKFQKNQENCLIENQEDDWEDEPWYGLSF